MDCEAELFGERHLWRNMLPPSSRRKKWYVPPRSWVVPQLHGIITQKTILFIVTQVSEVASCL
jgi:hypothetical protein